ncbi:MAG: hotdog domain-containing protein [Ilumatobacteraceae bacterium]
MNEPPRPEPEHGATGDDEMPDPWHMRHRDPDIGGPDFGALVEAMRDLQDRFVAANPPLDQTRRITTALTSLAAELSEWEAPEFGAPAAMRNDLPGRGSALLVPAVLDCQTETSVQGRVTFRRFHLGGHGAAHGGTIPLLFDDVMGRLVNGANRTVSRTAYLHVNYRMITRLGVELRFEATVDRIEGRKRWASGCLWEGDALVADVEGLFVELRPGQP